MSSYLIFSLTIAALALIFLNNYSIRLFDNVYKFIKSISASAVSGILDDQYVRRFVRRHRRLSGFLAQRFERHDFYGLPLTLLVLVFSYALFLFCGVVEDILKSALITNVDERLNQLMILFREPYLIKIYWWITNLCRWEVMLVLGAAMTLIFWLKNKGRFILSFWLSFFGTALFVSLSKIVFHRPRPPYPVYVENSYSFPSWHAAASVAIFGFIAYFLIKNIRRKKYKAYVIIITLGLIFFVGFSRIYLGVHYLSDVWGGNLLGLLWLIAGIGLFEWRQSRPPAEDIIAGRFRPNKRPLVILLAGVPVCFYVLFTIQTFPVIIHPLTEQPPARVDSALEAFREKGLPRYSESITAARQEPLSFIFISTRADFLGAMAAAGWSLADQISLASVEKSAQAALLNRPYPRAPITPVFWNGEANTYGFEKNTAEDTIRQRHHARFWDSNLITDDGQNIFVGTASFDTNIKWGFMHQIAPDVDAERETLFSDLQAAGAVKNFSREQFVAPVMGRNFTGDEFFTDGKIYMVKL